MTALRLKFVFLTLACACALMWNTSGSEAAKLTQSAGEGVVLQPSNSQGGQIVEPGYFENTAAAGTQVQLHAMVGNLEHHIAAIVLSPVDAGSGVYGGVSYGLPRQRLRHVGSWITLSATRFKLAPGKAALVNITLHVPARTPPGQYVGGLTAYVPAAHAGASRQHAGSLVLQLRRVVAIVITVPGRTYERFALGKTVIKQRPDAYYLVTHIKNSGTILSRARGSLWVWKQGFKHPVVRATLALDTTVPHTTVHYPLFWSHHIWPGLYHYSVSLSWTTGKTGRRGTFRVR